MEHEGVRTLWQDGGIDHVIAHKIHSVGVIPVDVNHDEQIRRVGPRNRVLSVDWELFPSDGIQK